MITKNILFRCLPLAGFALFHAGAPVAHAQGADTQPLRFDILEYLVEGNTVLPADGIERAVYPYLGPQRTVADVEQARAALERAYQDAGYLSVSVELPEQQVGEGAITLKVIEGKVEKLKVTGAEYHLPSRIREGVPSLAVGSVPQFSEVQAELGALGGQADRRITPLMRPGKAPGTLEVELAVEDELPLHGSIELNNKQSYNTDWGRVEAGVRYDNLFQRGHSVGINWIYAPSNPDHANIWSANYSVPLEGGNQVYGFVTVSDSDTPADLGGATVVKGTSLGLRYRRALPTRGGAFVHGLAVGADYKDAQDGTQINGAAFERSLKYWTLAARYDFTGFNDEGQVAGTFETDLVAGLRGLARRTVDCDGVQEDQFACKRNNASSGFLVWRLGGEWREAVYGDWSLRLRGDGQLASGPLVSQEQFGAGGIDSVRGYYEFEQFGDHGARFNLELMTPTLASIGGVRTYALGFIDRARLWVIDALPGEVGRINLASYGLGLRAESKSLSGRVDWGMPVFGTGRTERHDPRLHVSFKYQF